MRWWYQEGIWLQNDWSVTDILEGDKEYQTSIDKYPIVTEPKLYVANAGGWNATTNKT